MFTKGLLEQCRTFDMELFSLKPYFKNVLNSIESHLGSIFAWLTRLWKSLQLKTLEDDSLKMVTGKCNWNISIFL